MKLEEIAENENTIICKFKETEIIGAVIDLKEQKGKIVHGNTVIEEYHGIKNKEDLEKVTEERKFDLAAKTAIIVYITHNNQNTK